jgi:hypothetical protein
MKIFTSLNIGILRSLKSWKGLVFVWLFSFLMVSLIVIPMKSALKAGLGDSMVTEKLAHGIDVEVFADMGANLRSLSSYFSGGLLMALITGFIFNSFLSGGLFNCIRGSSAPFSSGEFFRASAKNFRPFLLISFIISLTVLALAFLIIIVPVLIVAMEEVSPEGGIIKTAIIATSFFLLLLTVLFLVADYARAWLTTHESNSGLKALGFGFRQTFRTFFQSFSLMLIILIVEFVYSWLVFIILAALRPSAETGILFLFILSQLLFFIKILLKVWRYGSVTVMMESENYTGNQEQ